MTFIFGFTLLRNGVKYDYCFKESLSSLLAVTEKVYLALGDSEDKTEEEIDKFDRVEKIHTVWDPEKRSGGLILSEQTNIALEGLKEREAPLEAKWGIYLQCDEVFHEEDYDLIVEDIKRAEIEGCDVVQFRYLHFWQDHHSLAINKKWYPQEIRAVRLDSNIESWGDAQSFRNYKKAYYSDARIFHYGHVREKDKYLSKKKDILKLYHSDERLPKYKKREKKFDDQTECLNFLGNHPLLMKERIERFQDVWDFPTVKEQYIVGDKDLLSVGFVKKINAESVIFVNSIFEVPRKSRKDAVILNEGLWDKLFYRSSVPVKMRSKLAKIWPMEFYTTLKLSEKKVSLRT